MKWVRSNIRHGSRLALLALAIQFLLTFGHFHGVGVQGATATAANLAFTASAIDRPHPQPGSSDPESSGDLCAICAVMALANLALFTPPPILPSPQAVEFSYPATGTAFVDLDSATVAFRSRAPPAA
jgi:hypothetical protein